MKYKKKLNNQGMTLPELILAVLMLTAFTGITVIVTEFTSRFFQPLNVEVEEGAIEAKSEETNDMFNDHSLINDTFDSIIEMLSEPGINKSFILNLKCTSLPSLEWGIPSIDTKAIPKSYKICIKPTTLSESDYLQLANAEGKPGIYILYSKPNQGVSVNATPIRRIFCRPKPFCKL
tara:strand:- start:626 stop:1156 length:531 start_codon:yes stop_codon:yes gene_type:complete